MRQKQALKRVLIMAGGTGGHVFPGLAVAHYLREQGVEVHWLGTGVGLESRVVPEAGFPFHVISIKGVRGKGTKSLLMAPFQVATAIWQSLRHLAHINPDVVIGMGGFVCGPGGIASWLKRRPLILHEQNAKAGYTNKILAHAARRILEGFPTAFTPQPKVITIGNPVRLEIENLPPPCERLAANRSPFHLLVLGGSLGAKALNHLVPRAVAMLPQEERPVILHQTGEMHFDSTKALYESEGVEANLVPFIKEMGQAYAWADMVICRAGALTIAELCVAGLGAILVPFPFAVDDHQTANADFMVSHHAALCIQQRELTEERLAAIVKDFAKSPAQRLAMAEAAYQLRKVNVVNRIFDICEEICR